MRRVKTPKIKTFKPQLSVRLPSRVTRTNVLGQHTGMLPKTKGQAGTPWRD